MDIDETINQWFTEAKGLMKDQRYLKNDSQLDSFCLSSLLVLENYLKNTLLILKNGSKLPAKALLRICGEFTVKFLWCTKNSTRKKPDSAGENCVRWLKFSLKQDQTLREKILNCFTGENKKKLQEKIGVTQKALDSIKNKCMPRFKDVFKDVFGADNKITYGGMYLLFLNSVHIDLRTISDTIVKKDNIISCKGDEVEDNLHALMTDCLTCAYMFLKGLYLFYELCFDSIEKQYDRLLEINLEK